MQSKKVKSVNTGMCDRFIQACKLSGLTYQALAGVMGLKSTSAFVEIKNHIVEPSKSQIYKLCDTFGVSADWLFFGGDHMYRELVEPHTVSQELKSVYNRLSRIEKLLTQKK